MEQVISEVMRMVSDAVASGRVIVFNSDVDEKLREVPVQVWDTIAGIAILFGMALSLGGPRTAKLVLFVLSCMVGGLLCAYVLSLIDEHVPPNLWLGLVSGAALATALLVNQVVAMGKFICFIGLGVMLAGVINQYGMAYLDIEQDPLVIRSVLVLAVIGSALLIWHSFEFAMDLTMSVCGGFVVFLAVSWLTGSPVSLAGMWADPSLLVQCKDIECWTPLFAGAAVALLGMCEKLGLLPGCGTSTGTRRNLDQPLLE